MGREGAWIGAEENLHRIEPVIVSDVIDTNGAGDAWASGFLYGYLRDWPLETCGALASLVGAETVRHLGPIIPAEQWSKLLPRAHALSPR
jgi:sugar/nucleoside kinase (ribokinase family)